MAKQKRAPNGDRPPRSLVVVSDLHCGCRMGLCPPEGARLDDGGTYKPSDFQLHLWNLWQSFWREHVPRMTNGESYVVVVNGETIDGVHHGTTTQWSHNLADQAKCALAVLRSIPINGQIYIIRGTEAHSGKSGQWDEWIARELGATQSREGQYSRHELWKRLGNGLVHITHHVGTTSSSAYESTALYRELVEAYVDAGRWGDRPPDAIVRSHRHRHIRVDVATGRGQAVAVVTPGWQGKTPFAFRIAGARQSQPQFGGIVLRWSEESGIYEQHQVWRLDRPQAE